MSTLVGGFRVVIVDGEAGIEQLTRQVLQKIDLAVVVSDGSYRGERVAAEIASLLRTHAPGAPRPGLVRSRGRGGGDAPPGLTLWGLVPTDEEVAACDARGDSLLHVLSGDSVALAAVREILERQSLIPL
jgi:CO dehydrogenase maturation factor